MKQFMCSANQRLRNWRDFRYSIQNLTQEEQLNEIVNWWSTAPFILQPVISWDDPGEWPTPWDILYEGDFCRSAISYLMQQTLVCLGWDESRFQFWLVKNLDQEEIHFVLVLDDYYLLNFYLGEITNIDSLTDKCLILMKYQCKED